jgi:signal transduction histidine kinase/ActR/RegA family two-component response regulator
MHNTVPLFNWSLNRALQSLPDSFARAKLRILIVVLLFSLLKAIVVICVAAAADQQLQLVRAVAGVFVYTAILKFLLAYPGRVKLFAHMMLSIGLVMIWSNILFYVHEPNIPVLQFAFMTILGSFYMLNSRTAFVYSGLAILPIAIATFTNNFYIDSNAEQLASPGFEILNVLNFGTIIIAHYFFHKAFTENVAEKETLNKELQQSIAAAQKLAEARQQFVSTMSHELRTPLNSVLGVTELLLEDSTDQQQKDHLEILRYSTSDLLSLINNILDINKLEANKVQLESAPVKLYDLATNLCSVLQLKAREKHLFLSVECDEELKSMVVLTDPTRVIQVLYNLAGNAIRFTEKGGVTLKMQLLNTKKEIAEVEFKITDTGIGIAPEMHSRIFEPFAQASIDTTRKYGGTGLGLAIVKQVLDQFHATINLKSNVGEGSVFSFILHLPVANNISAAQKHEEVPKSKLEMKILVAEDNEINQLVLQKQLDRLEVNAVIVSNGVEAYDAFVQEDFDAVLLDLDMPQQDGYETIKKMRALKNPSKSQAHIIAFTASVTEQDFIAKSGFNDHLYKPVNMQELREKLQKVNKSQPI